MSFSIALDLFPLIAALLAVITCGLLGNFLVLRKQSLMGDAISHAVLPGIVIAFLVTSSREPLIMFGGAAIAGMLTVVLIELVKKLGRVEPGAAMGVVFSVMFAFGVLLIEKASARHVDLDADCVLYGQLETLAWFGAPAQWSGLWTTSTLTAVPRQVWLLLTMCAMAGLFVTLLFKELRIASFDPGLATAQGINASWMHYLLMVFVAAATVAAFEAVGSILVIAMLIAPAATSRLLTDRLAPQIWCSLLVAVLTALVGYFSATSLPALFDAPSVNAAGSMTVVSGVLVFLAAIFSPSHGVVSRMRRRKRLGRETDMDDFLAGLFRLHGSGESHPQLSSVTGALAAPITIQRAARKALIEKQGGTVRLTGSGQKRAEEVSRRRKQWEGYLVDDAGLQPDHVEATVEKLEHLPIVPEDAGQSED